NAGARDDLRGAPRDRSGAATRDSAALRLSGAFPRRVAGGARRRARTTAEDRAGHLRPAAQGRALVTRGDRGAFADPPDPERPLSPPPSYGVPTEGGELMAWAFVVAEIAKARNYWVITVGRQSGPHAAPVWGAFVDDDLFFETAPSTRKARNL